ncbi:hypothetical protein GLOIN_2v1789957 [Rhizophagus irregularis DAOM 181602=DAOM 197198]|nr:hypothetical protein GLOIN_2v1789957 [Rhizophagus irregularis DAOM 181602=DAOM 197198]
MLIQMNDDELQLIYQNITQLNDNEKDINDDKEGSVCIPDNTNYISGKTGGAISVFNKLSGANLFQIPCELHVAHIIINNFEEVSSLILVDFYRKNLRQIFYI